MSNNKLAIKLEDLYSDKALAAKQNELNIILNAKPKPDWVKQHPTITNYKYLPIERVEWLLTMIFQKWKVEVKQVQHIANAVVVTVRLHVQNPLTGEWDYQDGVGAAPLQVDKGASAINWEKIKAAAVQMSAPSAESYAIKDAAEKFGAIFGKDINRKDIMSYEGLQGKFQSAKEEEVLEFQAAVAQISTLEEMRQFYEDNKGRGKQYDEIMTQRMNLF